MDIFPVLKLPPDQDGITIVPLLKVIAPPENVPVVLEFENVRLPLVIEMPVAEKLVIIALVKENPPTLVGELSWTFPMLTLPADQSEILIFPAELVILPVDKLPVVQFDMVKLPVMVMVEVMKEPPDQTGTLIPPLFKVMVPYENVPVVLEFTKDKFPDVMVIPEEVKLVMVASVNVILLPTVMELFLVKKRVATFLMSNFPVMAIVPPFFVNDMLDPSTRKSLPMVRLPLT